MWRAYLAKWSNYSSITLASRCFLILRIIMKCKKEIQHERNIVKIGEKLLYYIQRFVVSQMVARALRKPRRVVFNSRREKWPIQRNLESRSNRRNQREWCYIRGVRKNEKKMMLRLCKRTSNRLERARVYKRFPIIFSLEPRDAYWQRTRGLASHQISVAASAIGSLPMLLRC